MEVKLQKWGNSTGIRISKVILNSLNIKENDILNIEKNDNKIIISVPLKKVSLEERFKKYHGKNLAKEFTWDENVGKEIW